MQLKNDLLLYQSQNPHCDIFLDVASAIDKKYLAMEKEQIMEAWKNGFMSSSDGWNGEIPPECYGEKLDFEQFYNETYGKEN